MSIDDDPSSREMDPHARIPEETIETVARSLYREGLNYGFAHLDFVRFVNVLLDIAISGRPGKGQTLPGDAPRPPDEHTQRSLLTRLPACDGRVMLRQLDSDRDLGLMEGWLAEPHCRYFLMTCAFARFDNFLSLLSDPGNRFAVICLPNGQPIGALGFLHIDPVQQKAELRKLIGDPQFRGQGYAKQASRLWIRYGFEVLGLRKIYLDTVKTNLRNIHLNESLGFKIEGILRNEIQLDGQELDVLRMGMSRPSRQ